jgi:hypothetical protein
VRVRLRISVTCDDIGRRVTVRKHLASGGFSDVVGILENCDDEQFSVRDRTGKLRRIQRTEIAAAKVVPAPRPPRA